MALNSSTFSVASSGSVNITSGDSKSFNGIGGDVSIEAGSGLSMQGGSGGDVLLKAGDGMGEDRYGGFKFLNKSKIMCITIYILS